MGFRHLLQQRLNGVLVGTLMCPHDGSLVHEGGQAHVRRPHHDGVCLGRWRMGACIEGVDSRRGRIELGAKERGKGGLIGLPYRVRVRKRVEECD